MNTITAETKVCVLLGDPVGHSLSPLIHNAAFRELGINAVYLALPVKEKDFEGAIQGMRAFHFQGASITIPHKVRAVEHMDSLDPVAREIGSINTIVNRNGKLKGFNSDGMGALKALRDHQVNLDGKSVLVLGSGGVARAISFALTMGTRLTKLCIAGIIKEEVISLVDDLQQATESPVQGETMEGKALGIEIPGFDIIINCTPVGMSPDINKSPVPDGLLEKNQLVFDVVYNPLQTRLLKEAEWFGCDTISGVEMFINQAVVQFELWTGEKAPEEVMRKVVLGHLAAQQS